MPKIVDHDSQRGRFAEAVIRLVAREGLEGLTMRGVPQPTPEEVLSPTE